MKEEYGYVLTADTSKFKAKIKEAGQFIKAFGQGVKENFSEQVERSFNEDFKFGDRDYQKRIDYIKDKMDAVTDQINAIKLGGKEGNLEELEAEYDRLNDKLEKLTRYQKEYNGELEEADDKASGMSINLGAMFDKSIGKIKRFTFYLLGARSIFSLFMKYQGIYYQYNEQMQYQSELSQNAIALSLAPAFEFLGNVIAYASIAFAKFIELLTGVNILSKVSTKGIRDYNKSLKESQSLLSGIDEITNLTLPGSSGLASQYKALNDFQKKVAEVEKFFKENKWIQSLVDGLKKVWDWLQRGYDYIKQHWDVFKYIIGGVALTTFLGFALTGAGVGTMALIATLSILGVAGALEEIERLKKSVHDMKKNELDGWPKVFDAIIERIKKCEKGTIEWDKQASMLHDSTYSILKNIASGKLSYEEYGPVVDELLEKLQGLDDEEFEADIELLLQTKTAKEDYDRFYKSINNRQVQLNVKTVFGGVISGTQEVGTTLMKNIAKALGIKGFATGLDYVPYDNYPAILHKGEAVVPAKYNPEIHGMGNDYTNSLLETLIVKMDNLANRPNVFEIDGQKFANATYNLYDNARERQNYVEGVVR